MKTPPPGSTLAFAWSHCIVSQATQRSHPGETQQHTTLRKKPGNNKHGRSADVAKLVGQATSDTQSIPTY